MTFGVIDKKTGEYPDLEQIARTEEWAQNILPCDIYMDFVSMRTGTCF